jgi:hypothetical protein
MKSPVVKRSIVVAGHKTSVSLEEAFWNGMKEISGLRDMTLSELVGETAIASRAIYPRRSVSSCSITSAPARCPLCRIQGRRARALSPPPVQGCNDET